MGPLQDTASRIRQDVISGQTISGNLLLVIHFHFRLEYFNDIDMIENVSAMQARREKEEI